MASSAARYKSHGLHSLFFLSSTLEWSKGRSCVRDEGEVKKSLTKEGRLPVWFPRKIEGSYPDVTNCKMTFSGNRHTILNVLKWKIKELLML